MASNDVLAINTAQMSVKTRSTGRQQTVVTMTIKSEPVTFNLDPKFLLKAPAEALAESIREQTKAIAEPVKPATAKARANAERAFARGAPWAVRQFSGGRTGVTPPKSSARTAFSHSGRLADGIVARYSEKNHEFVLNYPANRWNPKDWPSLDKMQLQINRWIALVPALSRPSDDVRVQNAFKRTNKEMVQVHREGTSHKRAVETLRLFNDALDAAEGLLTA